MGLFRPTYVQYPSTLPPTHTQPTLPCDGSHSLVGHVQSLRTGGRWFDPRALPVFFPKIGVSLFDKIHSSLTAVHCFGKGYFGKQPVAWKEYCAEY